MMPFIFKSTANNKSDTDCWISPRKPISWKLFSFISLFFGGFFHSGPKLTFT